MGSPSQGLPNDPNLGLDQPNLGLDQGIQGLPGQDLSHDGGIGDMPASGSHPMDPMSSPPGGFEQQASNPMVPASTPQPSQQFSAPAGDSKRDMDLIVAKLDMIKSELDAMNQRLLRIESLSERPSTGQPMPTSAQMRKYAREY